MKQLISWLKYLFKKLTNDDIYKSVRRVDVLIYAKKHKSMGLCYTLYLALKYYYPNLRNFKDTMYSESLRKAFPLFRVDEALKFGATPNRIFWWPVGVWDGGREAFLDWLIEQYKDDQTNLKTLQL